LERSGERWAFWMDRDEPTSENIWKEMNGFGKVWTEISIFRKA